MKTNWLSIPVSVALVVISFSCKGEKKKQTKTNVAEEVKETPVMSASYSVDPKKSIIEWTGTKPLGKHTGTIEITNGTIDVKEGGIRSGSFTIDMNSISVTDLKGEEKTGLEGHLKGAAEGKEDHFFNVAKFPEASFEITGITEKEGKSYIQGNLTVKGIKKNISFPVNMTIDYNTVTLETEAFTINRTDWGVNYASKSLIADIGDKFIHDDIELKIRVRANNIQ